MKFFSALVSLVATASAVDLYYHDHPICHGDQPWIRCTNINPNTCCYYSTPDVGKYQRGIAIRGIQPGWNVQMRGYIGGNCANLVLVEGNNGRDGFCFEGGYSGIGYNFVGRKRAESEDNSECERPDALGLPDGTEYDLTGLDEEEYTNFINASVDATSPEDLPEQFRSLRTK